MRTQKWRKLYNMVSFRLHFCFLVLFVVFLIPGHCLGHLCLPKKHVALFIFGDSLFDAGNNDYINTTTDTQANFGPYGETFFKYPSGRFSNGRLIPDFIGKMSIYILLSLGFELFLNWLLKLHYITAEFANLPFITPYLYPGYHRYTDGTNFASAGAGALVETNKGLVYMLLFTLIRHIYCLFYIYTHIKINTYFTQV